MKLAFCLFNYFPYGGLQRDFLRIAKAAHAAGHEIHVYTMQWEGPAESFLHLHEIPIKAWQNHTRARRFAEKVREETAKQPVDLIIGFNKMPYLDWYYAADVCYQRRAKQKHGFFYRLLPRYREWLSLEKSVFAQGKATQILLISPLQQAEYVSCYDTEATRFHLLPNLRPAARQTTGS